MKSINKHFGEKVQSKSLRLITLILLTNIAGCMALFIYFSFAESIWMGLYAGVLTFGNILIPTTVAVLIFLLIKRWVKISSPTLNIIIQMLLLFTTFILGLLIWSTFEALFVSSLDWELIKVVYDSEFSGFLPVVLTEAILIPIIDLYFTRRKKTET